MKAYYSIIKYFPDINRDEGFGIGLIMISDSFVHPITRFSKDRIKRINSAYDLYKSKLVELLIQELSKRKMDISYLEYLSKYENGTIRYTVPKLVVDQDVEKKFEVLYEKYIADYNELRSDEKNGKKIFKLGHELRKKLSSDEKLSISLNIGYEFKKNELSTLLFKNTNIDFIGGNGTIFCGEIINLENEEDTVKKNFYKTITLFEALEKTYGRMKRFEPSECKILISKNQAEKSEHDEYMTIIDCWSKKAHYDLLIEDNMDSFVNKIKKIVNDKNIISYEEWNKKLQIGQLFREN